MSESVIIFGNGITIDTYGREYCEIIKRDEIVDFYVKNDKIDKDSLFSSKFYPDLFSYAKNTDLIKLGGKVLSEIIRIESLAPPSCDNMGNIAVFQRNIDVFQRNIDVFQSNIVDLWNNIAVFNGYCDYIYKLFWYYDKQMSAVNIICKGIAIFSKNIHRMGKCPTIINLNYDLVVEKHGGFKS